MKFILSVLPEHVVIGYPAPKTFDVSNWDIIRSGQCAFDLPYEQLRALGSGTYEFSDTPEERKVSSPRRISLSEFSRSEMHTR